MKPTLKPGIYGYVLALLTLLFLFRVLGQALVVFFSVDWLPPSKEWASGLIPYPALLTIQIVMIIVMVKITSDIWRGTGFFAAPRSSWSRFLIGFSIVYAGSMALRYMLAMIFLPEMRWFGGTIPILFHFVLAAFLYIWGKFAAQDAIFARPGDAC